jgi:hypothetical protein
MAQQEDDGRREHRSPGKTRVWRAEAVGLIVIVLVVLLFIVLRGGVNWSAR